MIGGVLLIAVVLGAFFLVIRTALYPFEWVAYWLGRGDRPSYWEMAHSWTFDGPPNG